MVPLRQIIQPLTLIIFCLSAIAGPAAGANDSLSRLTDKARSVGSVRLIVKLHAPKMMEVYLPAEKVAEQRKATAALRQNLINDLIATSSMRRDQIKRTYRVSPSIALEAAPDVLEALINDPRVESIEEDQLRGINLDQSTSVIGADASWPAFLGGNGQVVAVLDSGVDATHPALASRVVAEACFSTNDTFVNLITAEIGGYATSLCPGRAAESAATDSGLHCDISTWGDYCSHGTHVAGIVASTGAGAPELQGVAPQASIIAVQVFSGIDDLTANGALCGVSQPCLSAFDSDIIAGLEHVFLLRDTFNIAAVNLSLGGGEAAAVCDDSAYQTIIEQLREARIATVIAAGNDGLDGITTFPACISNAVTVGSSTKTDTLSSFSNVAPWVDLMAPGSDICSTIADGDASDCGTGYGTKQGTSMAAPHVAGAFAIMRALNPMATVAELESQMKATGVPINTYLGSLPRIQLDDAVAMSANNATKPPLVNIATRGFVGTGDDVLIGGFIVGDGGATHGGPAPGPSHADRGGPGALTDPTLTVFEGQTPIASNDNWQTDASSALTQESGLSPPRALEPALLLNLDPGEYTVIVSGVGGVTGLGIVEVFELSFGSLPQS